MNDKSEGAGRSLSGHQRAFEGATDEWYTPPEIFTALRLEFDLDPCSPLDGPVPWIPAKRFLTARENGLAAPWEGRVWLNPPYGNQTGRWLSRLATHGDGMALIPARVDTKWFHEWGVLADAICFLQGRPHFYNAKLERAPFNSGAPIMLLAYGLACTHAILACDLGRVARIASTRMGASAAGRLLLWEDAS